MTKIFVARHGQDIDNSNSILNEHRDMSLSPIGHMQAWVRVSCSI